MTRFYLIALSALTLTACNATAPEQQTPSAAAYASRSVTDPHFKLPEGAGCTGDIARYQAVMDNDYTTGNVGQGVYKQINGEIAQARTACASGNDTGARAMIAASKKRHGYPE
ncbi:hypothetical protein [Methylovirgula sp. 4M-Z18]|uniref:hypothetical protein n=1 Tax=Methylovirgula sp. 4M-Z18 TaxID=2293567 RepID=UPI000E2E7D5F|nr:hypothetical protein [Methylovirgula sp. 4M-Z18]RFB75068.1 hypothetical protein DYH55_22760 [Methylovirgula sp. 4M-Z18]